MVHIDNDLLRHGSQVGRRVVLISRRGRRVFAGELWIKDYLVSVGYRSKKVVNRPCRFIGKVVAGEGEFMLLACTGA